MPSRPPNTQAHAVPLLLLNICNTWTNLALSTPALWATIDLHGSPSVDSLHLWLQRARHYPLSISLNQSLNGDVAAVLGKYSERLKHLELYDREHAIGSFHHCPALRPSQLAHFREARITWISNVLSGYFGSRRTSCDVPLWISRFSPPALISWMTT
ncbi:hypothetical protein K438DRAFT_1228912 [Mycena galopus ATCC 62051]|nr:hypothetical protein K438DRAFT_1228912 [Mycena galopus ATCC 62051]